MKSDSKLFGLFCRTVVLPARRSLGGGGLYCRKKLCLAFRQLDSSTARQRFFRNQKGIALLVVLSSLMILATSVIELTYNSRIHYRTAVYAKNKLQAYYLAQSALNFSKLILKYHKETESMLERASESIGSVNVEPIYRMFPLSSELLRGMVGGDITGLFPTEDETGEGEGGEEEGGLKEEEVKSAMGLIQREEAEKFLSFEGDFFVEISEEQTKFDLNKIADLETTSNSYDHRKKFLSSILMLPQFEELFEDHDGDSEKLVQALGDWVDPNSLINDYNNIQRGSEDSLYSDVKYKIKNGKFITISELRLVAGMNDDILSALEPFISVYNGGEKVNVCLNENDDILRALIYHYTHNAGCTASIDYDDEKKMEELVEKVMAACPEPSSMSAAINSQLGLSDLELGTASSGSTGTTTTEGEAVAGCAFQFKDFLTKDNKVFTVKAIGTVGDIETKITVAINIEANRPRQWKYYYYRIE